MAYESIKIYDEDYARAGEIRASRGIAIIEAIGCALEGWNRLTAKQQDQIIRERAARKHAVPEPDAPVASVA